MIPLNEARRQIFQTVERLHPTALPLADALGLVTSIDLFAEECVPPFANSAMDGYALQAADTRGASEAAPVRLHVIEELPAGKAPTRTVGSGEASRVMTGAPVPLGADAVVMVELTTRAGSGSETDGSDTDGSGSDGSGNGDVLVQRAAMPGDHVRLAGGDIELGDLIFPHGTLLTPAHLGVLASLGYLRVPVFPRPVVGVLSTGDELINEQDSSQSAALRPGMIRDSNRPMLLALLRASGCEPVDLGIVRDDEDAIADAIDKAVGRCHALVTTGGVSVGDYDFVKAVLDRLGEMSWWQVAIKPAKPMAFGVVRGVPVFGLPGNPVSSHVSFELFVRPALLGTMGRVDRFRPMITARAEHAMSRRPDGKMHFDRVIVRMVDGEPVAARSGAQGSNVLSAMAAANALAILPDGEGVAEADPVTCMLLDAPAWLSPSSFTLD